MRLHLPGREPRPHVERDLSNWDQVQAYFAEHGPHVGFQRFFFAAMDKLVAPTLVYAPGAQEEIAEHLHSGDPTVMAMTHHSWFDPSNDAAALWQEKETFDGIIGKIIVPARMDYFDMPVIGSIISTGGAKPMARKKDLAHYFESLGHSPEEIDALLDSTGEHRKGANRIMQALMVRMALSGLVYASYIEGTRNRGDQTKLQPVKNGIKDLMETMEEPEKTRIITLSHDYDGARILPRRFLTPTIYVDIIEVPSDPEQVNELLHHTLETGMHHAIEHRRQRGDAPLSPLGKFLSLTAVAGAAVAADKLMARR